MSINVHTCKTYQVEHADACVCGWKKTEDFLAFLRKKQSEDEMDGIWIGENEDDVEIALATLEKLKDDPIWGKTIQNIIDDADKRNDYARLAIY